VNKVLSTLFRSQFHLGTIQLILAWKNIAKQKRLWDPMGSIVPNNDHEEVGHRLNC
jgi:hypothetical protein